MREMVIGDMLACLAKLGFAHEQRFAHGLEVCFLAIAQPKVFEGMSTNCNL